MDKRRNLLIGQILLDLGYLNMAQVNEARRKQLLSDPKKRQSLGDILCQLGYVTSEQIEDALRHQEGKSC